MEYYNAGKSYENLKEERRPNWGEPTVERTLSPLREKSGGLKSFGKLREALEASSKSDADLIEKPTLSAPKSKKSTPASMVDLIQEKKSFLRGLGIKLPFSRFPRDARKLLKQHAKGNSWDQEKLSAEMGNLDVILKKIDERRGDLQSFAEKKLTLEKCNEWLKGYGLEMEASLSKAKVTLKGLFVCLYDVMEGNFERKFNSISALRRYIVNNELYFPKKVAKSECADIFLKKILF